MTLRPHRGLVLRLCTSWRHQIFAVRASPMAFGGSDVMSRRSLSTGGGDNKKKASKFQPQRRPNRNYRPIAPYVVKKKGPSPVGLIKNPLKEIVDLDSIDDDSLATFGHKADDALEYLRKLRSGQSHGISDPDAYIRLADYFTAESGTTEDLVGERKALAAEITDPVERERFLWELDKFIDEERIRQLKLDEYEDDDDDDGADNDETYEDEEADNERTGKLSDAQLKALAEAEDGEADGFESNDGEDEEFTVDEDMIVKGRWATELISVDYVQKPQKGGRKGSYRALAIGGNGNGCGGFAMAKADTIDRAVEMAIRNTKKNPYFVERFQGCMLTRDLAGRHNSCIVRLRTCYNGLRGNDLVSTILLHFGVTHCNSKTHGNRNDYNVVYATFKALMTHESMEDIALKRGRRLISVERAKRLQV